jgi:hypothetical protein
MPKRGVDELISDKIEKINFSYSDGVWNTFKDYLVGPPRGSLLSFSFEVPMSLGVGASTPFYFLESRTAVGSNSISHKLNLPQNWLFFYYPLPLHF